MRTQEESPFGIRTTVPVPVGTRTIRVLFLHSANQATLIQTLPKRESCAALSIILKDYLVTCSVREYPLQYSVQCARVYIPVRSHLSNIACVETSRVFGTVA